MESEPPSTDIPGYQFDPRRDFLGQGGMATVYKGEQQALARTVAIKVVQEELAKDPSFTDRFLREGRILAKMSHPNIVAVYEAGVHEGTHYLSMEYVSGGDLRSQITRGMTFEDVSTVLTEVSRALTYLHAEGYVHRDVKPENILFRSDGTVALSDFGIAKPLEEGTTLTVAGSVVGTPAYLSPEQIRDDQIDGRSDIYSLGIVLYEMLTGSKPFQGEAAQVVNQQLSHPLPPLPEHQAIWQNLIDRMTAKRASDRFGSASEVIEAVSSLREKSAPATTVIAQEALPDPVPRKSTWMGLPVFDEQREQRFQAEHIRNALPMVRLTIPMSAVMTLLFFLWDFAQPGTNAIVAFSIRLLFALSGVALLIYTFTRTFRKNAQLSLTLLAMLAATHVAIVLFTIPDGFTAGNAGICLTMTYGSCLLCLQFRQTVLFLLWVIISTNALIVFAEHSHSLTYVLINTNFFIIAFFFAGAVFSYLLELNYRSRFAESGAFASPWFPQTAKPSEPEDSGSKRVFVCYRRDSSVDVVGRIGDRLSATLGEHAVLKDVNIVPLGADYRTYLGRVIRHCEVMLVVITPTWTKEFKGEERTSDPVITEIELALNLGLKVIPVLTGGATVPDAKELPERISALAFHNGLPIRPDPDFEGDMARLTQAINT